MHRINLTEILIKRRQSPNNATSELRKELVKIGCTKLLGNKSRVELNGEIFNVTITPETKNVVDARQHNESEAQGIITLWLRDSNLYLIRNIDLETGSVTREQGPDSFRQAKGIIALSSTALLSIITPLTFPEYLNIIDNVINIPDTSTQEFRQRIIGYNS